MKKIALINMCRAVWRGERKDRKIGVNRRLSEKNQMKINMSVKWRGTPWGEGQGSKRRHCRDQIYKLGY